MQILGIGKNGHIGFNEPGSSFHSKTRVIHLDQQTRIANTYEFHDLNKVPKLAITVGISSIMKAKKIVLLAWGDKASIVAKSIEGDVTEQIPATVLQNHDDCTFVIDELASSDLTRNKAPWLTGSNEWTPNMIKSAVIPTNDLMSRIQREMCFKPANPCVAIFVEDCRQGKLL